MIWLNDVGDVTGDGLLIRWVSVCAVCTCLFFGFHFFFKVLCRERWNILRQLGQGCRERSLYAQNSHSLKTSCFCVCTMNGEWTSGVESRYKMYCNKSYRETQDVSPRDYPDFAFNFECNYRGGRVSGGYHFGCERFWAAAGWPGMLPTLAKMCFVLAATQTWSCSTLKENLNCM